MSIGMSYDEFWNQDVALVRAYRQADDLRRQRQNEMLWMQGVYMRDALLCTVGNMFAGKGATPIEYPQEPYSITATQIAQKKEASSVKPTELYCAMIAPIRDFTAKGFLWYQGCSNLDDNDHYDTMMARMVQQWREDWGDTENKMPFYFTMIAPHSYGNSRAIAYPLFVECQQRALANIPNCAMAATTDTGEEVNIHPAKKNEIAQRMAAFALRDVYGQGGVDVIAPTYASHRVNGSNIFVKFNNTGAGLCPGSGKPIAGFEIAGADKVFHAAEARLEGGEVKVWSNEVKEPVAVRYAFRNYIPCNFMNIMGQPVVPFRTDNWNDAK